ncbi:antibiotic biosynthesis monooxygenase [Pseudomonas putida]|nr:antibiotic biosynthesis monooxygenase [Pseudomonas putida]
MYSLFIKTRVKPGCAEDFLTAIKVNAAASQSPLNLVAWHSMCRKTGSTRS